MITLHDLDFLASPAGERLLDELSTGDLSDANTLVLLTWLRRAVTPAQASAVLTLARLRQKAAEKFGADACRMYFTSDALQQASDPLAREYRARRFNHAGIVDACCGIGADALAFAQNGSHVTGIDFDPVRVAMSRLNRIPE